ncbi:MULTISPECIES: ABC transporter permease [unclassified Streptomyces]|uniref:ABC transporter permease n=1 Tax=Streptomyces TaxID=1883 RepID=UPI0001C1C520|nr:MULTISPECIES: ABC transporter permease [unclassified Streptomyces]MYR68185.1 ABC transporter permease subunit [Streptomyces sp. SID4939]MYS03253.1 ABC transporter permease subunit [Streptomyces sp. SID4940]MYT66853.1 ABC transporter permease subunit [Streptomyces sp. SID8357]MYT88370.1 ABC transporter permease subunit [Streptomyces sp. SID8360]MYU33283.1 ABC transporter permease subunit [Streptomyces sp. SID8358]MYW39561.1 ABC transporter permease subunit [Streptomyces sp. SID1]
MRAYLLRRSLLAVLQCLVVLVAVFAVGALLPGDTADVLRGELGTPEQVAALRTRLGLDEPAWSRFGHWLGGLFTGHLGNSLTTGLPVGDDIGRRIGVTLLLGVPALVLVTVLAPLLGTVSGLREGSRLDRTLNAATVVLHAVPEFVLGLLLVASVSLAAGLLPATAIGMDTEALLAQPAVLVLPVTVLTARHLCDLARQIRAGVAAGRHGAVAAHLRLLGVRERTVVLRHVLPGALGPAAQQFARCVEGLLGGAVLVEAVFGFRGLGDGFVEAVQNRDLPQVQTYALLFAGTAVAVNLIGDLAAHRLAPRREMTA